MVRRRLSPSMRRLRTKLSSTIQAYPALAFFVLTYVYSWLVWAPLLTIPVDVASGEYSTMAWVGVALLYLGGFGPLVAAAIVVKTGGGDIRTWARQIVDWRVGLQWWAIALGLPIFATVAVSILYISFGGPYDIDSMTPLLFYVPLLLFTVVFSGGLNEEPGWRGLALPILQERHSALTASIVIGVIWAVWHVPLFFAPVAPHSDYPLISQILYFPAVIVWSILLTWVYNGSASVLIAMFLHAGLNMAGGWIPLDPEGIIIGGVVQEEYVELVASLNLSVYLIIGIVIVAVFGWRRLARKEIPTRKIAGFHSDNDSSGAAK
jgi:uncharacterized protein